MRRYTWKDGIKDGIITPLKVVIQYLDPDKMSEDDFLTTEEREVVEEMILEQGEVNQTLHASGNVKVTAKEFAAIQGIINAFDRGVSSHVLTFHSRITHAERFSRVCEALSRGRNVYTTSIKAETSGQARNKIFNDFIRINNIFFRLTHFF